MHRIEMEIEDLRERISMGDHEAWRSGISKMDLNGRSGDRWIEMADQGSQIMDLRVDCERSELIAKIRGSEMIAEIKVLRAEIMDR